MKYFVFLLFILVINLSPVNGQSVVTDYQYDPLNRLTQVTYPDGTQIVYEYDEIGNRISKTVTTVPENCVLEEGGLSFTTECLGSAPFQSYNFMVEFGEPSDNAGNTFLFTATAQDGTVFSSPFPAFAGPTNSIGNRIQGLDPDEIYTFKVTLADDPTCADSIVGSYYPQITYDLSDELCAESNLFELSVSIDDNGLFDSYGFEVLGFEPVLLGPNESVTYSLQSGDQTSVLYFPEDDRSLMDCFGLSGLLGLECTSGPTNGCLPPLSFDAVSNTLTSISLSWNPQSGQNDYQITYYPTSQGESAAVVLNNIPGSSALLSNLNPGTSYTIEIRSNCGNDTSGPSRVIISTLADTDSPMECNSPPVIDNISTNCSESGTYSATVSFSASEGTTFDVFTDLPVVFGVDNFNGVVPGTYTFSGIPNGEDFTIIVENEDFPTDCNTSQFVPAPNCGGISCADPPQVSVSNEGCDGGNQFFFTLTVAGNSAYDITTNPDVGQNKINVAAGPFTFTNFEGDGSDIVVTVTDRLLSDCSVAVNISSIDCDAPTCFDGQQNGDETGIDCGGSCVPCTNNPNIDLTLSVGPGECLETDDELVIDYVATDVNTIMRMELCRVEPDGSNLCGPIDLLIFAPVGSRSLEIGNFGSGTYFIRMSAPSIDYSVDSYGFLINACDDSPTCGSPGSLNVSNITPASATVSWASASGDVDYYEVSYGLQGSGFPIVLATNNTSINLNGLDDNRQYEVRVRAICTLGSSGFRFEVFSTPEEENDGGNPVGGICEAPTRPSVGQPELGEVEFFWEGPGQFASFVFYREVGSGSFSSEEGNGESSVNPVTNYDATVSVSPGRTYEYYAETDCGGFPRSVSGFFTADQPPCSDPPADITVVAVTENTVTLDWDVVDPEAIYTVEIFNATTGQSVDFVSGIEGEDVPVELFALSSGTEYDFRVRTDCFADGSSEWSDLGSFVTVGTVATADQNSICVGEAVNFSYSGPTVESYSWRLGPGDFEFSDQPSPSYTFDNAGNFLVTLITTDASGQEETYFIGIQVASPINISIETVAAACDMGTTGSLTVLLEGDDVPADYMILWSTGETTSTIFPTMDGNYSVTVTPPGGCADSLETNYDMNSGTQTFYADTDMDGLGDPNNSITACSQPTGFVENADDCDDGNPEASTLNIVCATPEPAYFANQASCSYLVESNLLDASSDCSFATITNDYNDSSSLQGASFGLGTTTVVFTATQAGASTSCSIDIVVLDNIAPLVFGNDTILYLDEMGMASLTIDDVAQDTVENCTVVDAELFLGDTLSQMATLMEGTSAGGNLISGGFALALPQTLFFNCDDAGNIYEVLIVATDQSGNMDTTTIQVTILDTIPPTITCEDIDVFLDADGAAVIENDDA
ncbi:MAG: fibronectin type III domain-containing protein, partial [Bacteroidota bacterium]